jgi:hypothetical protein
VEKLIRMPLTPFVKKSWPLLATIALAVIGVVIFRVFLNWNNLNLTVKVSDLAGLLAPLAFAATVIERAVEILVSPWRDEGASKLDKVVAAIKARPADPATDAANATDLRAASDALDEYRGDTQRYAFAVSLVLSVMVSIAGVRALGPFVDSAKLKDSAVTADAQRLFFLDVDVALSAALLAGGADAIHSVMNAITSFFDNTAEKKA